MNAPLQDKNNPSVADDALSSIVEGFKRFRRDVFPAQEELFKKLATAQNPLAMFITCADSRIVPELITQSSPGDAGVEGSSGGGAITSAPRRAGGGESDSRVEPHDERLSSAAQRPSSSAARERTGTPSTGRAIVSSPRGSPSRRSTTMPVRTRPRSGALTRCPR